MTVMKFDLSRWLSLKILLTVPFVVQLMIVIGGISWLAYYSTWQAINLLTLSLLEDIGERLQGEIDNFLEKPIALTQEHQDLIDLGILNLNDLEPWGSYLYKQYLNHRHDFLTAFMVSNQANEFRAAGHTYNKQGQILQGLGEVGRKTQYNYYGYSSLENYQKKRNPKILANRYKVTNRPWYTQVIKTGKMQWTPLFAHRVFQKHLVINFSRPLYNGKRSQLLGVTSIQVDLSYLNKFLQSLKIGRTGSIFIIDKNGYLIATSNGQSQLEVVNGKAVPLLATKSPNLITKNISQTLLNLPVKKFEKQYFSSLVINSQKYFVLALPLQQQNGLQWLAIIVIPQADILGKIWQNQRVTFLLSGLALLMAIIIGLISAYYITQPITRLSQATLALSEGDWQKKLKASSITELQNLVQAFKKMAYQLKEYVKQLQSQEQKLRQFLEAIPIGITVYNLEKQQIFINKEGNILLAASLEFFEKNMQKILIGESFTLDDITIKVNHQSIVVKILGKPIFDEANKIIFALIIIEDITDRKQAEILLKDYNKILTQEVEKQTQELADAKEKAEIANQAKSILLTNMSHELKTPLHAVLGFTDIVVNDPALPKHLTQSLNIVRKNSRNLFLLITNILDLAKIEAGKLSIQPQSLNFLDFIRDIEAIFQLSSEIKNLDFQVSFLTACPRLIRVDATKLRQILFNLLSNAFKFTSVGSISLTVSLQKLDQENAQLNFWIEDTGVGISQSEQELLFNAFYRGQNPDPLIEGTGLGLMLTQEYIKLLGGSISLESEVLQGTRIYFCLPVQILQAEIQTEQTNLVAKDKVKISKFMSLTPKIIEGISPQWCRAFYEALTALDELTMLGLLAELEPDHPQLTQDLGKLVKAVEIDRLIDIFSLLPTEDN